MEKYFIFMDRRLNSVKIAVLPRMIYRSTTIPIKKQTDFIVKTDRLILKFIWNFRGPRIARQSWKKNNNVGFPILKLTTKQWFIIKTVWYWHKLEYIWESRDKNCVCGQLICHKNTKTMERGKISLQQIVLGPSGIPMQMNEIVSLFHTPYKD